MSLAVVSAQGHEHWYQAGSLLAVAALVVVVVAWVLYARALRVDRLHRQVLGSRATLEAQLVHRAQAAAEIASLGLLDPASALLVSRAAHEALEAEGPLVDDGLDPETVSGVALDDPARSRSRAAAESDLSRVLRTVVSQPVREQLAGSQAGREALERLDRSSYRLVIARRFHNTHVAQARQLRSRWLVRAAHLAGHAPVPAALDMDDDVTPVPDEEPVTSAATPEEAL
ncbi:hypothetical protein [Actinomyces faecalis]|uniref:hypothetical protein n=1 Tax=Actinomyces faecalis TaxID=2722820 RepID=UPI0015518C51|nr:hypothetical protein [Actinomyces faecalis]